MMKNGLLVALAGAAMLFAGCGTSYAWRSRVPENMRTVSVPNFRNESLVMEVGPIMARQLAREFQREGTFKIAASSDEAALEVQGIVKSVGGKSVAYDRRSGMRMSSYVFSGKVEVSVIDKRNGKVLIDNRLYKPQTTYTAGQDLDTAMRDATGRLAEDLARLVVDDILNLNYDESSGKEKGAEL